MSTIYTGCLLPVDICSASTTTTWIARRRSIKIQKKKIFIWLKNNFKTSSSSWLTLLGSDLRICLCRRKKWLGSIYT